MWISDDLPWIIELGQVPDARVDRSRNCSGPPVSTMPLTGWPTATLPTAIATSSAAIGWKSADGKRTLSPSVEVSAMPLNKLEELRRAHDRVRNG